MVDTIEAMRKHIEALQAENEQLQEFANAKTDGRLVVLPCKIGEYEQMIREFGILGEEIENLKAENKRLKEERDELFEIFIRHVMRKMYPTKCTNVIQVFESREKYDKVAKFIFEIIQRRGNGI